MGEDGCVVCEGCDRADELAEAVEWAYNDAVYTAPEDHQRRNRQWQVMLRALRKYRTGIEE